ncbi:MAG: SPFH domain-containing protein [Lentisphaeria bacterium]|nr:SPFH domain-containing protein [Lentisphaeria bacterium]
MAIVDIVKFDVPSDDYIVQKFDSGKQWELALGSQLVVNEGQEAIFVKGGIALDTFTPGTHTLVSGNVPLLNAILKIPFGGVTPFTTEVWFINKTVKRNMPWGTPQRIPVIEPQLGYPINVGACGQWGFRVVDSRSFVTQLVGAQLGADSQKIYSYFIGEIREKFGQTINALLAAGNPFFTVNSRLTEIANMVTDTIHEEFERFGIEIVNFNITSINIPPNEMTQIQAIMAKKMEMQQLGNVQIGQGYVTAKSLEIMQTAAQNQGGAGAFMGAAAGIGLGMGASFPLANSIAQTVTPAVQATQQNTSPESPANKLLTLKTLLENRLITQDEYNAKRAEIIASI